MKHEPIFRCTCNYVCNTYNKLQKHIDTNTKEASRIT